MRFNKTAALTKSFIGYEKKKKLIPLRGTYLHRPLRAERNAPMWFLQWRALYPLCRRKVLRCWQPFGRVDGKSSGQPNELVCMYYQSPFTPIKPGTIKARGSVGGYSIIKLNDVFDRIPYLRADIVF